MTRPHLARLALAGAGLLALAGAASAAPNEIRGTDRNDQLVGTDGPDHIVALGGSDWIQAGGGADVVEGGGGKDDIHGGAGPDVLDGGGERDELYGDEGDDRLYGGAGRDYLSGGKGYDRLYGGPGRDSLACDEGADLLEGGADGDEIDGRYGDCTASYAGSPAGVIVDLSMGRGHGGDAEGDRFVEIADVIGSWYDDVLWGDDRNNVLTGLSGNNRLMGGGGNDRLVLGGGVDVADGGAGFDVASYASLVGPVTVDLADGTANRGAAAGDKLIAIESVIGTRRADVLRGGPGNDTLDGNGTDFMTGGRDVLDGRGGDDTLVLRDGEIATGGPGADMFLADLSSGPTVLDFDGAAGDRIVIDVDAYNVPHSQRFQLDYGHPPLLVSGVAPRPTVEAPTFVYDTETGTVWLAAYGTASSHINIQVVQLKNRPVLTAEHFVMRGSHYDGKRIFPNRNSDRGYLGFGSDGNDVIGGSDWEDEVYANGGDDLILGSPGADKLSGGIGRNAVSYAASPARVEVDLRRWSGVGGDADGDQLSSIDEVVGSRFGDWLKGGWGPSARLFGRGGDDTLVGVNGDDVLAPGTGTNRLTGGEGLNIASYEDVPGPVTIDLADRGRDRGEPVGDVFVAIAGLRGTDRGDDLAGDERANVIEGQWGDDVLAGRGGADVLDGGAGADRLEGGPGADRFRFAAARDAGDTLVDFDAGEGDKLVLGELLDVTGIGFDFRAGTTPRPNKPQTTLLYVTGNGALLLDPDGTERRPAYLLATLAGAPALTAAAVVRETSPSWSSGATETVGR